MQSKAHGKNNYKNNPTNPQLLRKEEKLGVTAILSGGQCKKKDVRNLEGKKTLG